MASNGAGLRYTFVRDASGKLVPLDPEPRPSADDLLERFREEKARTAETLQRAGSTARVISRSLRRTASQQALRLSLVPSPDPEKPPAE
jgi:hypothetical protein